MAKATRWTPIWSRGKMSRQRDSFRRNQCQNHQHLTWSRLQKTSLLMMITSLKTLLNLWKAAIQSCLRGKLKLWTCLTLLLRSKSRCPLTSSIFRWGRWRATTDLPQWPSAPSKALLQNRRSSQLSKVEAMLLQTNLARKILQQRRRNRRRPQIRQRRWNWMTLRQGMQLRRSS